METTTWRKAGISPTRMGFGCLPIQRLGKKEAAALVRRAYDAGARFFDTARAYTDSEEKVALALGDVRSEIIIATKTAAKTAAEFERDLAASLKTLQTNYIDIYQFHNPPFVPIPGGADGLYDAMKRAQSEGKVRFIGITQHSGERAMQAVRSGLYDTLQYPFNRLATDEDIALVRACEEAGMGFIAMKALSGGLVTDAAIPFAYLRQFEHVVPIWGFQREEELQQVLGFEATPPALDDEMRKKIDQDRAQLAGSFCRGCGYCLPCPAGIPINNANRMTQLLTRSPVQGWLTPEMRAEMRRIDECIQCRACESRCPYHLKPYETLKGHLDFYEELYKHYHPED